MTSPDAECLRYGRIAGTAAKHAPIWGLGGQAKAVAIAELAEVHPADVHAPDAVGT